jgi:preprotein translocase subunit YajC
MDLIVYAVLAIGAVWFITSRGKKQQAAALSFRDNLEPGQEVMTIGRMYATVLEVNDNRITLELSDGVVGVWDKDGIARLVFPPVDDDDEDGDAEDDEYDDDEYDDELEDDDDDYDDEALDDELDDLDAELDEAAVGEGESGEDVPDLDEPVGGAIYQPAADDESVDATDDVKTDKDWPGVEVPDDASSLIDPDTDDKKKPL